MGHLVLSDVQGCDANCRGACCFVVDDVASSKNNLDRLLEASFPYLAVTPCSPGVATAPAGD